MMLPFRSTSWLAIGSGDASDRPVGRPALRRPPPHGCLGRVRFVTVHWAKAVGLIKPTAAATTRLRFAHRTLRSQSPVSWFTTPRAQRGLFAWLAPQRSDLPAIHALLLTNRCDSGQLFVRHSRYDFAHLGRWAVFAIIPLSWAATLTESRDQLAEFSGLVWPAPQGNTAPPISRSSLRW